MSIYMMAEHEAVLYTERLQARLATVARAEKVEAFCNLCNMRGINFRCTSSIKPCQAGLPHGLSNVRVLDRPFTCQALAAL